MIPKLLNLKTVTYHVGHAAQIKLSLTPKQILDEKRVIDCYQRYLKTFSEEKIIKKCVNLYLQHQTNTSSKNELKMDPKIQFINRIHLLHPHEYEKFKSHLVSKNTWRCDPSTESLQAPPDVKAFELMLPELRFCSIDDPADEFLPYQTFLVNACKRHKDFINKASLMDLYEDEKKAERLISHYRNFLYLKSLHPSVFLVPTIGTDLVWHTHLLDHENYKKETAALFGGIFMNHTDDVVEEETKHQFQQTMKYWKDAFGEVPTNKPRTKKRKDNESSSIKDRAGDILGEVLIDRFSNRLSHQPAKTETEILPKTDTDSVIYEAHDDFGQCNAVCTGIAEYAGCGTGSCSSGSTGGGSSGDSSSCGSSCGSGCGGCG